MEGLTSRRPRRFLAEDPWVWLLFLATCCLFSFTSRVSADGPDSFKQGNAAYAVGKFDEAASLYQSARDAGLHHWRLYYNWGNADYKAGKLGHAVLNYERAFRLNSGQRDVIYNLQLASMKAGDPKLPASALPALLWRFFFWISLNTLTFLTSLLFIGFGAWLTSVMAGKAKWTSDIAMPLGFSLLVLGFWLAGRIHMDQRKEGVVVSNLAEVRSGPNMSYPANFTVPEGHRVLLLDVEEPVTGWVEIGIPDQGLKGWVPSDSLEPI